MTRLVKSGQYTGKVSAAKVVYVGHSFGSSVSVAALGDDASLADGVVLTGKHAQSGLLRFTITN